MARRTRDFLINTTLLSDCPKAWYGVGFARKDRERMTDSGNECTGSNEQAGEVPSLGSALPRGATGIGEVPTT